MSVELHGARTNACAQKEVGGREIVHSTATAQYSTTQYSHSAQHSTATAQYSHSTTQHNTTHHNTTKMNEHTSHTTNCWIGGLVDTYVQAAEQGLTALALQLPTAIQVVFCSDQDHLHRSQAHHHH